MGRIFGYISFSVLEMFGARIYASGVYIPTFSPLNATLAAYEHYTYPCLTSWSLPTCACSEICTELQLVHPMTSNSFTVPGCCALILFHHSLRKGFLSQS